MSVDFKKPPESNAYTAQLVFTCGWRLERRCTTWPTTHKVYFSIHCTTH